jgi:hypothetical protein
MPLKYADIGKPRAACLARACKRHDDHYQSGVAFGKDIVRAKSRSVGHPITSEEQGS